MLRWMSVIACVVSDSPNGRREGVQYSCEFVCVRNYELQLMFHLTCKEAIPFRVQCFVRLWS